jgi:putative tricarboxylic transport membrane protein
MRLSGETLSGGFILLFGAAATVLSYNTGSVAWGGESARLFPLAISITITVMGGFLVFASLRRSESILDFGTEAKGVLALALLGVFYVFALGKLGYLLATGLTAPVALFLFGVRSPLGLALSVALCPLIYHLIFFVGLGVFPPNGAWFDLLDIIKGF